MTTEERIEKVLTNLRTSQGLAPKGCGRTAVIGQHLAGPTRSRSVVLLEVDVDLVDLLETILRERTPATPPPAKVNNPRFRGILDPEI